MFRVVLGVFFFVAMVVIYVTIQKHVWSTSNMDLYELAPPYTRHMIEHVCRLRQPAVLPDVHIKELQHYFRAAEFQEHYAAYEWNVCSSGLSSTKAHHVPEVLARPFRALHRVFTHAAAPPPAVSSSLASTDDPRFFSEHNQAFLVDAGLDQVLMLHDDLFRPASSFLSRQYDVWSGEAGAATPLRYETAYRTFLYVTEGCVTIKLTAPRFSKYLYEHADAWNNEARSPVSPWRDVEEVAQQWPDAQKVPFMIATLQAGHVLFLPPRWWYSVQFTTPAPVVVKLQYMAWLDAVLWAPRQVNHWVHRTQARVKWVTATATETTPPTTADPRRLSTVHDDDVGLTSRQWQQLQFGRSPPTPPPVMDTPAPTPTPVPTMELDESAPVAKPRRPRFKLRGSSGGGSRKHVSDTRPESDASRAAPESEHTPPVVESVEITPHASVDDVVPDTSLEDANTTIE